MMDANEYQRAAIRTWEPESSIAVRALYLVSKLQAEAGEVAQLVAKWQMHGKPYTPSDLEDELGDVLWYAAVIAHDHGISFSDIMYRNIGKLQERHPNGNPAEYYQVSSS